MCYIYVLRSLRNNKRYVGSTRLTPQERLKQHNYGSNSWTRCNKPFELVYEEEQPDITTARKREKFLKSGVGRKFLDDTLRSKKEDTALAKD